MHAEISHCKIKQIYYLWNLIWSQIKSQISRYRIIIFDIKMDLTYFVRKSVNKPV